MRRLACLALVASAVLAVTASSWGSQAASSWKLTDLVKVARHRFPDYVNIRLVGATRDGTVYWTANGLNSDPRTLEVFSWRNGQMSDLGSPGPGLAVAAVNDRGQFAVFTAPVPLPTCPSSCPSPPRPPPHGYLWQRGKLQDLGALGGGGTGANAINDNGQIVGGSSVGKGQGASSHAFLWQDGKMTDLGTLAGGWSDATAINDNGQVIGTSDERGRPERGFIWQQGKLTDLGSLGRGDTTPTAINVRGQVIGQSGGYAFLWQSGHMSKLGKLDLTGYPLFCRNKHATKCSPDCPGPKCRLWGSVAKAIDRSGDVVGMTQTNQGLGRAFLSRNGTLTDLGTLGGRSSGALAIADNGTVVGWSDTELVPYSAEYAPRPRPVVWQNGRLVELPVDYPSPTLATAITPSGNVILGAGGWPPHQALIWTKR